MEVFLFIFSVVGLTWIVTASKLFKRLREYYTMKSEFYKPRPGNKPTKKYKAYWYVDSLLNCAGCFGFWAGIIVYLLQKYHCDVVLYALTSAFIGLIGININHLINRK